MSELSEKLREKCRSEGYRDGAIAERLQTIKLLQRIADSDDVDGALSEELDRLMTLQAAEMADGAQGKAGSQVNQAKEFAATITTARGTGGKDLQDCVAEMMRAQRGSAS
ncbi:MAG: hypothetical protein ABI548_27125 [Polyangiaceae bacterium]